MHQAYDAFYNFQKYGLQYNVGDGTNMWRFRALNGGISIGNRSAGDPTNPTTIVESGLYISKLNLTPPGQLS